MIPETFIESWRSKASWQTLAQVEQDLIISRVLVELYSESKIADAIVFRGGTALNKIFLHPPARYSEDLDFVQKQSEPIGATLDAIRHLLQPWLGEPKWKVTERSAKMVFTYQAINNLPSKLKIEINTTEHFQVMPLQIKKYEVNSEWYQGSGDIVIYALEELMATKLRALYQRRKGRDLFDLWYVFKQSPFDVKQVIDIFKKYCANDGIKITKRQFLNSLELKRMNRDFTNDMNVLLPNQIKWSFDEAFELVIDNILSELL